MKEIRKFRISEESAVATLSKFEKIANRSKSKGLEGGFTVLGITDEIYKDINTGIEYNYSVIEVECESVKFAGWEFLSVAEVEQGVVLTRGIGSSDEIKPSQVRVGYCDHCGTTRSRKKYIFVKNETGEIKQVGSTCVKDFLGWEFTPSFLPEWDSFEKESSSSGGFSGVDTGSVAIVALSVVAKEGYKSAKQFGYEGSTSSTVWDLLTNKKFRAEFGDFYGVNKSATADEIAKSQELIEFAKNFVGESAYAENLRATASLRFQTYKTVGLFISSIIARQKAEEQEVAKKTAKIYSTEPFGAVGTKIETEVTVLSSQVVESDWGSSTLWTFESGDYKLKWFESGYSFKAEIGEVVKIKGTIKGFNEYKGTYSTLLTRCKKVA